MMTTHATRTDDDLNASIARGYFGIDTHAHQTHVWQQTAEGEIDDTAFDSLDGHAGPYCTRCGYAFCSMCEDMTGWTGDLPCVQTIPAYTTNMNACMDLQAALAQRGWVPDYVRALIEILGRPVTSWALLMATARQRCEAAVVVLEAKMGSQESL